MREKTVIFFKYILSDDPFYSNKIKIQVTIFKHLVQNFHHSFSYDFETRDYRIDSAAAGNFCLNHPKPWQVCVA